MPVSSGNCVKTGARILLTEYRCVVSGDIFRVGDCFVVNFNPLSRDYDGLARRTHELTIGHSFYDERGIIVVPSEQLKGKVDD